MTKTHDLDPADAEKLVSASVHTLGGEPSSLASLDGKALLIVNVASRCGLTPHYEGLQKLHEELSGRDFAVVGFPCNQFGAQEPGSAEEIQAFCTTNYGVSFPMFEKIDVNGEGRHAIYEVLTGYADGDGKEGDVAWNFEKFVVSADRKKVTRFRPKTAPDDAQLRAAINAGLP